jgi:transposase
MRGKDEVRGSLFSDVDLEQRIRPDHPLRAIRGIVNAALAEMSAEFDALCPPMGRDSIPPERLLRALLLQAFSIRSERQLVERIDFDLLFRWFVGLGVDDPVWDATTFTKNRDRLLAGEVASRFLATVLTQPKVGALLSTEHFSVDGTLLEAWASTKSFRPKDGSGVPPDAGRNGEQDFRGQKRRNDTHASTTDPDARLHRKGPGKEAKLCFMGHALMENRNGLIVGAGATRASGHAERLAALHLVEPHADRPQKVTLGGDKGFDTQDFVAELREINVTPHLAQNISNGRRSAIDGRTTRHPGYAVSQRIRKRIEEAFGWAKTVAGLRKARHRGLAKVDWQFTFAMAADNLVRLPKLLGAALPCAPKDTLCSASGGSRAWNSGTPSSSTSLGPATSSSMQMAAVNSPSAPSRAGSTATSASTTSTSPGREATRWTTLAAMATPSSKRMAPSPVKSASTSAMSRRSPPAAGSFSAPC